MNYRRLVTPALAVALGAGAAFAYPLDLSEETGITRLEAYYLASTGAMRGQFLPDGALWPAEKVRLRLLDYPDFELPAPDPEFTASVEELLGADARDYGMSVLDLTDPAKPRYADHNGRYAQNPGSVGKIVVALAWFQTLADLYPDDIAARQDILKNTIIVANDFIQKDTHTVPFWKPGDAQVDKRPIEEGDSANLWTWMDWMCSSSSNAAASTLMSQLILLKHFGKQYPVPQATADAFFRDTPKKELTRIFLDVMQSSVTRNGLDLEQLRQGSFFTRLGKSRVPGVSSISTSRELLRYMILMEQGKLVDPWSSREIKRLLYLTEWRIRYGASPALRDSALIFKSGSLYSCKPEPGFVCGKYMGNRMNFLNSMTEVENPDGGIAYISVVLSNVLRKNSAEEHEALATGVHHLIESLHPM